MFSPDRLYLKIFVICFASLFSGCISVPLELGYLGPEKRPSSLDDYYEVSSSYSDYLEEVIVEEDEYTARRFDIQTDFGRMTVDYFQRTEPSDSLIFIFPILGGRNLFANYFAAYFAEHGFDTAVVHRDSTFKDPENYMRLEEIFRKNVIRDRIAMNFFENEFGKSRFGSFGISRGAINAAVTAGVDERLRYNVFALGGADLLHVFMNTTENGIIKYRRRVMKRYNISEDEFYSHLEKTIVSDPKHVAVHIDARNTLMFLSLFDTTVPIKYGLKLRRRIGHPQTEFFLADHYTALVYTQFVKLVPPADGFCIFPLGYVESKSLAFYRKSFGSQKSSLPHAIYSTLQAPFKLIGRIISALSR